MNELPSYAPDHNVSAEIVFIDELAPVVARIAEVVPREVLWDMFSSTPTETGGKIIFPYSRVDSAVINARDTVYLLKNFGSKYSPNKYREIYNSGCSQAFEALVWVEVGFGGLRNLAKSPASKNWTSAVGHTVTDHERERGIMTTGKQMYEKCLSDFAELRSELGISDDYFSQYGVEYLLDTVSSG